MNIQVRQEKEADFDAVFALIGKAFKSLTESGHEEQVLVQRLRKSHAFVPELSLIAEDEGIVIGHVLLTKISIKNSQNEFQSLALAPIAVLPAHQKKGIGGQLIKFAHHEAVKLGFESVILLGHSRYYPRFGYKKASDFNIKLPFEAPDEACMAIELVKNGLRNVNGMVMYPTAFFE